MGRRKFQIGDYVKPAKPGKPIVMGVYKVVDFTRHMPGGVIVYKIKNIKGRRTYEAFAEELNLFNLDTKEDSVKKKVPVKKVAPVQFNGVTYESGMQLKLTKDVYTWSSHLSGKCPLNKEAGKKGNIITIDQLEIEGIYPDQHLAFTCKENGYGWAIGFSDDKLFKIVKPNYQTKLEMNYSIY